jgi:hypothetical protein
MLKSKEKPKTITVYFGVPGSGKTTLAAYFARKHLKAGRKVYSNVPIIGTYKYSPIDDLGNNQIEDAYLILDEASIEFNNRNFKVFPKNCIEFFKIHRHYGVAIDVFSQSYEDMDITIRRLATKFILVKKSYIPYFIVTKTARHIIDIDKETKQFISGYEWKPLSWRWYFMPLAWKLFDSYDAPVKKSKQFEKWKSKNKESGMESSLLVEDGEAVKGESH